MNRRAFLEALSAIVIAARSDARLRSVGMAAAIPVPTSTPTSQQDGDPGLIPIPSSIPGVRQPVLPLAGIKLSEEWKFTEAAPQEFWKLNLDVSGWKNLQVPGEFATQGFSVISDVEYPCRRKISIPADYAEHRIFLRFDGIYSYARVWINGTYLRDHVGGFTSWDCEITEHVSPGETAELVIGVTDRSDDISQASYYAKHLIAGVLRDVRVFAVPLHCLSTLSASATLDSDYENGLIRLQAVFSSPENQTAELHCEMTDALGKPVPLDPGTVAIASGHAAIDHKLTVRSPKKWDAEHPNLYTLHVSVLVAGKVTETFQRQIGFRSVQRVGNQLMVNGQSVKLRGVCRHSIHPLYGRAVPPEFDERDAVLFREANINFVRTSHYPPTEQFLEACDRYGIYVEEETAVCWSKVVDGPSSDPAFTARFLSQFQEMLERDQDHACVLFWSLGNESQWGLNFAAEHSYAREHDPSRPLIISYPDSVPLQTDAYDIYSKHYPASDSSMESDVFPLLNDEFAHVSCYNLETLRRDPGVRDFWGISIKRFGDKFLAADGCLGGAIWAAIDDIFLLPQGPVGYGPWGIIDGWRRPKPEYWLTKKAYSPIRIVDAPLTSPGDGNLLTIAITNAYDHTNLSEIKIDWSVGAESDSLQANLPPHDSGYLEIPARRWRQGDVVDLRFSTADHSLVDQFQLRIGSEAPRLRAALVTDAPMAPAILRKGVDEILVDSGDLKIRVDRETGLIAQASLKDQILVQGGPFLDLGQGPLSSHWLLRSCDVDTKGDAFIIHTLGEAKSGSGFETIPVELVIQIEGSGLITTRYRAGISLAKYSQLGICYVLPESIDILSWKRKSLWSAYPKDHIGRAQGIAFRSAKHPAASYRSEPAWPWSEDMEDPFLGKSVAASHATNDFRSLKENIWYAACTSAGSDFRVRAEANGDVAARASVQPDGKVSFSLYNYWSYPDLEWGNYTGAGSASVVSHQEVDLRLTSQREE